MGTRYLTMVVNNKKTAIAQLGFYDGDPYTNGLEILRVLRKDEDQRIRGNLHRVSILPEEEYRSFFKNNWLDEEALEKAHPRFWWSDGADMLEMLFEDEDRTIETRMSKDFVYDSLMCEWAYVIDYDTQTFEVYKGFSRKPISPSERFYNEGRDKNGYYPVRLVAKFKLSELPSEERFKRIE